MHYHAHVYWTNEAQRNQALHIRELLAQLGCNLGRVMDMPIGPHPLPMYQANYSSANQTAVEAMLEKEAQDLSILLHEDTGDDVHDHTEGVRWLGTPLELDIAWLEEYQKHKH